MELLRSERSKHVYRWLVVGRSEHGVVLVRYWLRHEATMWRIRAALHRECGVARVEVIELATMPERKAS